MKVLIVSSGNSGSISSFVLEQAHELEKLNIQIKQFLIIGKGAYGYLKNWPKLMNIISEYKPDLIHAHYGLSGILANLQRKVPVITTYHGSDINDPFPFLFSKICMHLSKYNIFVSTKLSLKAKPKGNSSIISCGLDLHIFKELAEEEIKLTNKINSDTLNILFSSSFDIPVKNYKLARRAINKLSNANLIEMKGYTREQVNLLMNTCDLLLVTSLKESGPLVIKEALACGCPLVSTDVGDVKEVIGDTEGCYLTTFNPDEVAEKIKLAIEFSRLNRRTKGREKILKYDNKIVATKIFDIYRKVIG